jgi:hypothetical protein
MHVWVTCSGVVIGSADFEPAEGLAHTQLLTDFSYSLASAAAQELGYQFRRTQFWSPLAGDFADEAVARWTGGRLALEDDLGRELGVNNIVLIEFPILVDPPVVRIVADFRPDLARVESLLRSVGPGGGGRTRPAA